MASADEYDVATTVIVESSTGSPKKLKLKFNFVEEPTKVAQRFVEENGLPPYAMEYVHEYLKQYKMCVIKKSPMGADGATGEEAGKRFDVITSIEKVKTGVLSYLNPLAYVYPMDEMKLCFNYDDKADDVAKSFAKKYDLSLEDYERIVNYIKDIQQKHKDGSDGKDAPKDGEADEADGDWDIVTTITKPGQNKLTLRFNFTQNPREVAHAFVTDNGLSPDDEDRIFKYLNDRKQEKAKEDIFPLASVSVEQVSLLLKKWELSLYTEKFRAEGVDGAALLELELEDLQELGVGSRLQNKKLLRVVAQKKADGLLKEELATEEAAPAAAAQGEAA